MRSLVSIFISMFAIATGIGQPQAKPFPTSDTASSMRVIDALNLLEHGQPIEAIDSLQKLASVKPPVKGARRGLAIAYYRTGKLDEAEKAFITAIAEDPADIESIQMRGLTLYRMGRQTDAIPFLERARQWAPKANVDANYVLGLCYMHSQRYDEARAAFATQYSLSPDSGGAYLMMAQMLLHDELPELAARNAERALKISADLPLAHFMLGKVYLARLDSTHALEEFEQERKINPAFPATYEWLGDLYIRTGQYEQAQEWLTKAISLDQSSTGPYILMGKVFLQDNDPQTAAEYLQHAEQMDPNNYITHYLLAQAYKAVGNEADAKREFDVVSKLHSASQVNPEHVQ
jgi:tetratricopeptide (TPR) repeat protein